MPMFLNVRLPVAFMARLKMSALAVIGLLWSISMALAQVGLAKYADANGYIDVQKLTCAQLANTFQEDADFLTAWYSGWYNGLGKKHVMKVDRAKQLEHELTCIVRPILE